VEQVEQEGEREGEGEGKEEGGERVKVKGVVMAGV